LVRGARQVGKSFTIEKFCRENFRHPVVIDFELQPEYIQCFDQKDPSEILKQISILAKSDITAGESVLFLDEIQICPEAIESLRYFYEKKPDLHVIGAGSLLEFALEAKHFKMPVGRVSFLYMVPLSFMEFLDAIDETRAKQALADSSPENPLPKNIHERLLRHLKDYMLLGGMPAVVNEYIQTQKMQRCRDIQSDILESFRSDFGKYATKAEINYLQLVFDSLPLQVGKKFRYVTVDPNIKSAFLRNAVSLLEKAGVVHKIRKTSGGGFPLGASAVEKGYKIIFLDVGLLQNMCGLDADIIQASDVLAVYSGAVAEQFTGQELIAYSNNRKKDKLYYWERNAKNSNAEIDYVISKGSKISPIEVKSRAVGRLKSLLMFMEKYDIDLGYKVSQEPQGLYNKVESVPLYNIKSFYCPIRPT
jgi:predicted AAA+ superfamily ATPase